MSKLQYYEVHSVCNAPVAYFQSLANKKIEVTTCEGKDYKVRPSVILVNKQSLRNNYYQQALGVPFFTVSKNADRSFYVAEKWLIRMDEFMNVENPDTVAAPLNMFSVINVHKSLSGPWLNKYFHGTQHLSPVIVYYQTNKNTKQNMYVPPCPVEVQRKYDWEKDFPDANPIPYQFKTVQLENDFFHRMCGIILTGILENVISSGFEMDDFCVYEGNTLGVAYDANPLKPEIV